MSRDMLQLTGRRVSEIRSGLALIKDKRLPDGNAESLVVSLWMLLEPAATAFDAALKKVTDRAGEIDALEDGPEQVAELEQFRRDLEQVRASIFEVPAPRSILGLQHLPKAYKGEVGQMNTTGNAAAIIAMRPEFFASAAIEALQSGVPAPDDGEEA